MTKTLQPSSEINTSANVKNYPVQDEITHLDSTVCIDRPTEERRFPALICAGWYLSGTGSWVDGQ